MCTVPGKRQTRIRVPGSIFDFSSYSAGEGAARTLLAENVVQLDLVLVVSELCVVNAKAPTYFLLLLKVVQHLVKRDDVRAELQSFELVLALELDVDGFLAEHFSFKAGLYIFPPSCFNLHAL